MADSHGLAPRRRSLDTGVSASHGPPAPSIAAPDTRADVAVRDWDDLFNAVQERLRAVVADCPVHGPDCPPCSGRQVRTAVMECTAVLDQLHHTMSHEMLRRQQLELEVFDTQTELAQARAELVGTQAGERRARHLAAHDGLTSLPNRRHFIERLEQMLGGAQRRALAVMYLDLDGFKPINDQHGHAAGDELLRIVAARLCRLVRSEDTVGRLGGDEFACLLDGMDDRAQLAQLAAKMFDAVSAPCKIGGLRLAVRPSIGIALCPQHGTSPLDLLERADAAMYVAKRQQCRLAFFRPDQGVAA